MTDMFVLLQLPNAGDDLQAMKKGIMELADLIVINKADLDPDAALRAQAQITSALRVLRFTGAPGTHDETRWQTRVMRGSALKADGLEAFWANVSDFRGLRERSGEFAARRREQSLRWMWDQVHARLLADFRDSAAVRAALPQALDDVARGRVAPSSAARRLLDLFEAH
jgi:LAO/AO transport system kinase